MYVTFIIFSRDPLGWRMEGIGIGHRAWAIARGRQTANKQKSGTPVVGGWVRGEKRTRAR
jgi:hypothetical protein